MPNLVPMSAIAALEAGEILETVIIKGCIDMVQYTVLYIGC